MGIKLRNSTFVDVAHLHVIKKFQDYLLIKSWIHGQNIFRYLVRNIFPPVQIQQFHHFLFQLLNATTSNVAFFGTVNSIFE